MGTSFSNGINNEDQASILFHGRNDSYIEVPRSPALDTKWSITILFYIFPISSSGPIINYKVDGSGVQIWQLPGTTAAKNQIMVRFNKRSLRYTTKLQMECLEVKNWNYIGASYDYDSGIARLYKNGQELQGVRIGKTTIGTQFDIRLGAIKYMTDYFNGKLSCLQIYERALSAEEIQSARHSCEPGKSKVRSFFHYVYCYL